MNFGKAMKANDWRWRWFSLVQICWWCVMNSAFGVTLAWDPSPDPSVVGYAVHYGTNSGKYQTRADVGNQTNATIHLPTNGTTFFFVALAYTVDGVESLPSNEVSYAPPAISTNQTIAFGTLAEKMFGAAAFPLEATASSGLPVSYESGNPSVAMVAGNMVTLVGAGSAVITASQSGDRNYLAAPSVSQELRVNTAVATVALSGLNATYDGTAKSVLVTTSPSGLPMTITYGGSATAPVNAGSYSVVATITDANYTGSANDTLTIGQQGQAITFGALTAKKVGDTIFPLSANASSGLPVSYESGNPSVAMVAGNMVTLVGAGSAVITASQSGDSNYTASANVTQTLEVGSAPSGELLITQTADGLNQQLRFSVGPSHRWRLQASADSLHWDTLCQLDAVTNGWIDFFDPILPSSPTRSYRVVSEPTNPSELARAADVSPNGLSLSPVANSRRFQVRFGVEANRHWQLQGSEDFQRWSVLCELTARADGCIDVFDSVIPGRSARFYRLVSAPAAP